MKTHTKILLILTFVLCYSCNQKQEDTLDNKLSELKSDSLNSNISLIDKSNKSDLDKIIGKYYVDNFHRYLKSGFGLKLEEPKDYSMLYTFEFKENGEIIFKDLTKFYGCGNGILSIKKGNWRAKGKASYELTFDGEYAFEHKFHSEAQYNFIELKNDDKKLKLTKVIINAKKTDWE